jgi:hypothetical protein
MPARSLPIIFSAISGWLLAMFVKSKDASVRLPALRESLWQVTQVRRTTPLSSSLAKTPAGALTSVCETARVGGGVCTPMGRGVESGVLARFGAVAPEKNRALGTRSLATPSETATPSTASRQPAPAAASGFIPKVSGAGREGRAGEPACRTTTRAHRQPVNSVAGRCVWQEQVYHEAPAPTLPPRVGRPHLRGCHPDRTVDSRPVGPLAPPPEEGPVCATFAY